MRWLLLFALCPLFFMPGADADPLIYNKTVIKIVPAAETFRLSDKKSTEASLKLHRPTKEFMVEVRPLSFLTQRDFIAHPPFGDKEGMMTLIDPPALVRLKSISLLGRADVLFVRPDGVIDKIAPEMTLSKTMEPLESERSVGAFVFLKSGAVQANEIRPGDRIDSPLFKIHPVILQ